MSLKMTSLLSRARDFFGVRRTCRRFYGRYSENNFSDKIISHHRVLGLRLRGGASNRNQLIPRGLRAAIPRLAQKRHRTPL
jgi:hypothetical protein